MAAASISPLDTQPFLPNWARCRHRALSRAFTTLANLESRPLHKSEAEGDWSCRGEDDDYTRSFEIEAGYDENSYLFWDSATEKFTVDVAEEVDG